MTGLQGSDLLAWREMYDFDVNNLSCLLKDGGRQ